MVIFLLVCDKSDEFLRVTIRKYALSLKRKVLRRKKAGRPPKGYLKYPFGGFTLAVAGRPASWLTPDRSHLILEIVVLEIVMKE
jgi:hypothetical protein